MRVSNVFEQDDEIVKIENGFVIVTREGSLVSIPLSCRPNRVSYYNEDYWLNSLITRTQHNFQFHLWNRKLKPFGL